MSLDECGSFGSKCPDRFSLSLSRGTVIEGQSQGDADWFARGRSSRTTHSRIARAQRSTFKSPSAVTRAATRATTFRSRVSADVKNRRRGRDISLSSRTRHREGRPARSQGRLFIRARCTRISLNALCIHRQSVSSRHPPYRNVREETPERAVRSGVYFDVASSIMPCEFRPRVIHLLPPSSISDREERRRRNGEDIRPTNDTFENPLSLLLFFLHRCQPLSRIRMCEYHALSYNR